VSFIPCKKTRFPADEWSKKDSREIEKGWKSDTSKNCNPSARERQQWHVDASIFRERDWICDRLCSRQLHVKPAYVCVVEVYRIIYRKYMIIAIAGGCRLLELIRTRDIRALIIQLYILYSTFNFITFSYLSFICNTR